MTKVLEQLQLVAQTSTTVLILGETGVGKGMLAQRVHTLSLRQANPFVMVNCGAIPTGLVEDELFGHEKGAFTSAVGRRIGRFEQAHKGTLFFDEIGDLPLEAQTTLLHVLEDHRLLRVGGEASIKVDVRIIAATNRDLRQAAEAGTFRKDLFYRLDVFPVMIPPLRERREDIPVLAEHFARLFAQELQRPAPRLSKEVLMHLQRPDYNWPGNVRELEHLIQRAVIICQSDSIRLEDVQISTEDLAKAPTMLEQGVVAKVDQIAEKVDQIAEIEKKMLIEALETTNWVIYGMQGAAYLLGMKPERLRSRMRVHGLQKPKKPS